jgi:hypothetical protein
MPGTEPLAESQPLEAQPQNSEFIDASNVEFAELLVVRLPGLRCSLPSR